MDLGKRFEEATAYASVSFASLEPHKQYPIVRAKRLSTKFGMSVVLTLRSSYTIVVQVFLPQRYSDFVTDADKQSINSGAADLNLVYKACVNPLRPISELLNSKYIYIYMCVCVYFLPNTPPYGFVRFFSMVRTVCFGPNRTWLIVRAMLCG